MGSKTSLSQFRASPTKGVFISSGFQIIDHRQFWLQRLDSPLGSSQTQPLHLSPLLCQVLEVDNELHHQSVGRSPKRLKGTLPVPNDVECMSLLNDPYQKGTRIDDTPLV